MVYSLVFFQDSVSWQVVITCHHYIPPNYTKIQMFIVYLFGNPKYVLGDPWKLLGIPPPSILQSPSVRGSTSSQPRDSRDSRASIYPGTCLRQEANDASWYEACWKGSVQSDFISWDFKGVENSVVNSWNFIKTRWETFILLVSLTIFMKPATILPPYTIMRSWKS